LNSDQLVLKTIAQRTKLVPETISESFSLYRRDLLFSVDYRTIVITIFNDVTIKDAINNVNFLFYVKEKYGSKVILILDKRSKFKEIYYVFGNLVDKIYECKRYIELHNICLKEKASKLMYNKALAAYEDIDYYTNDKYILADYTTINSAKKQEYPNTSSILSIRSTKDFNNDIKAVVNKIKDIKLSEMSHLDKNEPFLRNLNILINTNYYINIGNSDIMDYIAPFLGIKILALNTGLYKDPIFKCSASVYFNVIQNIRT
jgi:hypothetical protein